MSFIKLGLLISWCLVANQLMASPQVSQCMREQLTTSADSVTVGELRTYCEQVNAIAEPRDDEQPNLETTQTAVDIIPVESAITRRLFLEKKEDKNPFSLQPHKPNYIIISNNTASANEQPFKDAFPDDDVHFQPWETKFQISLKLPVARGLINHNGDLYVAYSNRSFWQQFNKDGSAPFRDSNHEPEAWLSFANDDEILGFKNSVIRTGIVHQSNGQSGELSRSWNRLYADFIFEKGNWYFSVKPWWRIPESRDNDDNPDIDDYLGNFELGGLYKKDSHTFDFMIRNNFDFSDNHGAIQLGWSFPISNRVRGYVQWFNGYGESLIDYDAHSNSLGFGIQLTDWL